MHFNFKYQKQNKAVVRSIETNISEIRREVHSIDSLLKGQVDLKNLDNNQKK